MPEGTVAQTWCGLTTKPVIDLENIAYAEAEPYIPVTFG